MSIFGDDSEKIECGKCKDKFKLKKITHVDGLVYCKSCAEEVVIEKEKKRAEITPDQIKDIIVTTTDTIQGREIEQYIDPIYTQVVMGIDSWKDMLGSLRSWWGGRSKTLERELATGYAFAIEDLKKEAFLRDANAVVGVEFDANLEVAGDAGSNDKMAIVSGMGTAVRLK